MTAGRLPRKSDRPMSKADFEALAIAFGYHGTKHMRSVLAGMQPTPLEEDQRGPYPRPERSERRGARS